jgi:hypothetical protein
MNPILRFNDARDQFDHDEQKGFMMLFSGAVARLPTGTSADQRRSGTPIGVGEGGAGLVQVTRAVAEDRQQCRDTDDL